MFPARRGGYYFRFNTHFYAAVRRAGLAGGGLNVHALRHTWCSRMLESGADPATIRDLGGWADLSILNRYAHHRPQREVEATAAMLALREAQRRHALTVVGGSASPTRC